MPPKVVIIGHGFTSRLAVTRSVAQIGCEVTLIVMAGYCKLCRNKLNTRKPIDGYSKYVSRILYCYAKDEEGLIHLLLSECADPNQKVVIIPDSDFSAAAIDRNQERLKDDFLFPHIHYTPGAVVEWMDKVKQKDLARQVGMNVAGANVIAVKNHQYSIPSTVNYPCFTKPLTTIGVGKRLLQRCNDEKELRAILDEAGDIGDLQVLVEDFKSIDTEYAVLGVSDGKEVVIPGIIQILVMAHGGHYGVASQGKVMHVAGFEALISQFKEFILRIGYVGLFDIDFYESNGVLYFGELNLRFGGSGYAVTKMGVNLPAMFVKICLSDEWKDPILEIKDSAVYVNERMVMDEWWNGFITYKELKHLFHSAGIHFVSSSVDSLPDKQLKREIKMRKFLIPIKKILKRSFIRI